MEIFAFAAIMLGMRDRIDLERHLETPLRSGAMRAQESRGRMAEEGEAPYRGLYQRDRDRIIHCGAFRRLEYKTQVFVHVAGGDHYRNRLTHTMEVTQIARTIARALGLNEDLVEALALSHDLGHGPFGHAGEDALNEVMGAHGGFNHNLQGLRIVDQLERRYADFPGLNLTYETREGFSKNLGQAARAKAGFIRAENTTLEVQVTGHADEIAYDTHDLEDGLVSGMLYEKSVLEVPLWRETELEVLAEHAMLIQDQSLRWKAVVRRLISKLTGDLMHETERRLQAARIENLSDVRSTREELVGFSKEMQPKKDALEQFLRHNFYWREEVRKPAHEWQERLKQLFEAYVKHPERLPEGYRRRGDSEGDSLERICCDYVAGMTDRYAERMWTDFKF